jgi:ADP-ribose pyrophosphatase
VLELPAGLIDPGEEPIETARRELIEETGISARVVEPLVAFYTSPGFTDEVIHIFVGTDLVGAIAEPDEEEEIEVVRMPVEDALQRVMYGEISDAKTVAGLLAYSRLENV